MNELALFSGVGGGILGGMLCGFKTVCAVEIDPYCREVLLQRQADGMLPMFPIWDDVKTFDGRIWNGEVDIITGGFPCQPFSIAGRREGDKDERNMWPDTVRIIREVRPRFAFLENVPGLIVHPYFGTILGDLAESGYDCQWACLGADDVGANHRRKRLWLLAYPKSKQNRRIFQPRIRSYIGTNCENVANAKTIHAQGFDHGQRQGEFGGSGWWELEPNVGRVAPRVPRRVDRLKALGNAQVPLAMAVAFHKLFERYLEQRSNLPLGAE